MKKLLLAILLIPSVYALSKCIEKNSYHIMLKGLLSRNVSEICVDSAAQLVDSAVFVDAREIAETNVSTIKNALAVGYDNFNIDSFPKLDTNQLIIVYCSVGYRSEKVTHKLQKKGFKNVHNLYGGVFEWVNHGFPVYHADSITQKVHAYNAIWGKWLQKGDKVY